MSCRTVDVERWIRRMWTVGVFVSFVTSLIWAKIDLDSQSRFRQDLKAVNILPPDLPPLMTQESVDLTLVMFGIDLPQNVHHPRLNLELADRGLTSNSSSSMLLDVEVGPAAFSSWGLLGSTLAHELEVHCQQSFFMIYMMDLFGLDGTGAAEREAYGHEIYNAQRFGLEPIDAMLIARTMRTYYPLQASEGFSLPNRISTWLARTLFAHSEIAHNDQ